MRLTRAQTRPGSPLLPLRPLPNRPGLSRPGGKVYLHSKSDSDLSSIPEDREKGQPRKTRGKIGNTAIILPITRFQRTNPLIQNSHQGTLPSYLLPEHAAEDFEEDEVRTRVVLHHLRSLLSAEDMHVETIDFDLAVASFLQETDHLNLGDIPISVNRVLEDFRKLCPLTMTQDQLKTCASHIRHTIDTYLTAPNNNNVPFALRYPNLAALKEMASERAVCPRPLPSGVAVLLLDEARRMLALGIPPKKFVEPPKFLAGEVSTVPTSDCTIRDFIKVLVMLIAMSLERPEFC